jgi:hypothetical protein
MANEMLIRLKWIKRDLNVSDELRVRWLKWGRGFKRSRGEITNICMQVGHYHQNDKQRMLLIIYKVHQQNITSTPSVQVTNNALQILYWFALYARTSPLVLTRKTLLQNSCHNGDNSLWRCKLTFSITSHNLHFLNFSHLLCLPELYIIQHEGPHIVTEPVCVQFACL